MKEAFEKIKERLKEARKECVKLQKTTDDAYGYMKQKHGIDVALSIVSEVEAEYGKKGCALCYLGSPCEYQNEDVRIPDELMGWIPCSERLPEENGRYITTNMYEGEKEEVFDLWYEDGNWFIDAGEDETIRIVIAWMPLPSPYKPTTD